MRTGLCEHVHPQTESAPYGDADKPIMLGHIEQLGPILYEYEHLITVLQAGFIGTWGECAFYVMSPNHSSVYHVYSLTQLCLSLHKAVLWIYWHMYTYTCTCTCIETEYRQL